MKSWMVDSMFRSELLAKVNISMGIFHGKSDPIFYFLSVC